MPKGGKIKPNYGAKLSENIPKGLSPSEKTWWKKIKSQINQTRGTGIGAADETIMVLAAQQGVRVDRFRKESAKSPLLIKDTHGNHKLHPVHAELRQAEGALRATLTTLCLTPRSRKGWKSQPDPVASSDFAEDEGLRLLG
jgi:hypothetical protein